MHNNGRLVMVTIARMGSIRWLSRITLPDLIISLTAKLTALPGFVRVNEPHSSSLRYCAAIEE